MKSSYPVPFVRMNLDHKARKTMGGYLNDSTGVNPCDPSSLTNVGQLRNAVYNVKVTTLPEG